MQGHDWGSWDGNRCCLNCGIHYTNKHLPCDPKEKPTPSAAEKPCPFCGGLGVKGQAVDRQEWTVNYRELITPIGNRYVIEEDHKTTTTPAKRLKDEINAALAAERQRAEQAEQLYDAAENERQIVKSQLLSALAAIEKHNKIWTVEGRDFSAEQIKDVDLSTLSEHEAELTEKVRKPLVDALERMFQVHILHCRQCAGPDDGCDEGQRLEQIKLDALAQCKQP